MKKIGLLLDSTRCTPYLYAVAEVVAGDPHAELYLLINRPRLATSFWGRVRERVRRRGLWRTIELVTFVLLVRLEMRVCAGHSEVQELARVRDLEELEHAGRMDLSPQFSASGLMVRYGEADIARLRNAGFDLLIRGNNTGIMQGDILTVAKDGVLSFHLGDNRWNRGGPPGFWEVYRRTPSTGFVIQTLTEELDGGEVRFRGNITTRRSFVLNQAHLFSESNVYFVWLLKQYLTSGRLPDAEPRMPFADRLLVVPDIWQQLSYVWLTAVMETRAVVLRRVLRRQIRWNVAFVASGWQTAELRRGTMIANLPGHFFADPFVVERDGRTICFLEDYVYASGRAHITAVELRGSKEYQLLGTAIAEPFHLSFPYLFEFESQLYMVPEAAEAREIRLYRCTQFPLRWEYCHNLMTAVTAVDVMVFPWGGKWWMLANLSDTGGGEGEYAALHAFHADSPVSREWVAHSGNPLVVDSSMARNGGLLRGSNGKLYRAGQRQDFDSYGSALGIYELKALTELDFEERKTADLGGRFFSRLRGCHHLHSNGRYTVYDFARREKY